MENNLGEKDYLSKIINNSIDSQQNSMKKIGNDIFTNVSSIAKLDIQSNVNNQSKILFLNESMGSSPNIFAS